MCVLIFGLYYKSDVGRITGDESSVVKGQPEFLMVVEVKTALRDFSPLPFPSQFFYSLLHLLVLHFQLLRPKKVLVKETPVFLRENGVT